MNDLCAILAASPGPLLTQAGCVIKGLSSDLGITVGHPPLINIAAALSTLCADGLIIILVSGV